MFTVHHISYLVIILTKNPVKVNIITLTLQMEVTGTAILRGSTLEVTPVLHSCRVQINLRVIPQVTLMLLWLMSEWPRLTLPCADCFASSTAILE